MYLTTFPRKKLAQEFPDISWQPTEYVPPQQASSEEEAFAKFGKIGEHRDPLQILDRNLSAFTNVRKALFLDLLNPESMRSFPEHAYDLVHVGNVLHFTGVEGFFMLCSRVLSSTGIATVYGPFKRHGAFTTDSNAQFNDMLRSKSPQFGLRDVESEVVPIASRYGLSLVSVHDMPNNNFLCVFRKDSSKL